MKDVCSTEAWIWMETVTPYLRVKRAMVFCGIFDEIIDNTPVYGRKYPISKTIRPEFWGIIDQNEVLSTAPGYYQSGQ